MTADPAASLAEEAARFIAAMQELADDADPGSVNGHRGAGADPDFDDERGFGEDQPAEDQRAHDPTSVTCRYCPVCNVARLVASVTPEVRAHLASAAMSLALAAKAWADGDGDRETDSAPVEKIDLAED